MNTFLSRLLGSLPVAAAKYNGFINEYGGWIILGGTLAGGAVGLAFGQTAKGILYGGLTSLTATVGTAFTASLISKS
jgi:hypothetical protein